MWGAEPEKGLTDMGQYGGDYGVGGQWGWKRV